MFSEVPCVGMFLIWGSSLQLVSCILHDEKTSHLLKANCVKRFAEPLRVDISSGYLI